jgi:tetratricopeptide (TPR) repeat protein
MRAASCARTLALSPRLLAILFLIAASLVSSKASALSDQREASLKATHGRAALLRGQYRDAETLLTESLQSGALLLPTRISALGNRGIARWRLGQSQAAIEDFNAALRLSPEEPMIYNNRGNVLLELRHYAEAAKDFTQAIALIPAYGSAYNNRGNARFLLGDLEGALADYTKAITLMPASAVPFNGRGKVQLALRRPAAALRDFSRAIVLGNRYGQALANRAEALAALHRYSDAANDYTAAIESGVDTARIYLGRAAAYNALNKTGKAIADLAHARERQGENAAAAEPASAHAAVPAAATSAVGGAPALTPCAARERNFRQVADASHGQANSLLVRTSNDVALANPPSGDGGGAVSTPCGFGARPVSDAGALDDDQGSESSREIATELDDWSLSRTEAGEYVARNRQHPKLRLVLEMYGAGDPDLLNWQVLKGTLRGVGLLHYDAGATPEGDRLEYIAVIDLWAGTVIAVEPARWGEHQASWSWSAFSVVVVDPLGVPSRVQVRAETAERPYHLKPRTKRVSRALPPRFSHRTSRRAPNFRYGFNPYTLR